MSFTDEDRRRGGAASKKHGIYALENRGATSLTETEQMTYSELREALRQPEMREEIKLELMARLATMMRFGFAEMERLSEQGRDVFDAPVTGRLGTYLNLLARLLGSYPSQKQDALAEEIRRIQQLVKDAERQANETVVETSDD